MIALSVILIGILLATAALRMARGHWMPVHAEHEGLDVVRLTIAGIPVEELGLDPGEISREKWHINRYILHAQWRFGLRAATPSSLLTITGL